MRVQQHGRRGGQSMGHKVAKAALVGRHKRLQLKCARCLLCTGHASTPQTTLSPFSAKHVSRVCRVLRRPAGHAALLGRSVAGLRSLVRTAAHVCQMILHEVRRGCLTSDSLQRGCKPSIKRVCTLCKFN